MDAVALTLGLCDIGGGILCILAALPLRAGRVQRNHLYGFRVRQAFASEQAWLAINRYGAARLIWWSIPMIALGVVALFLPLRSHSGLASALGLTSLIFVLIPCFQSWRYARRFGSGEDSQQKTRLAP